jgi:predicted Zn-dependent protease
MKKFITIVFLLVVIAMSFGFAILRIAANGSENNYFNQNLRVRFAKYPFWREVLYMHYDGDARNDYLGPKYSKILLEVDEMEGLSIPKESLDLLVQKIASATGKETSYFVSNTNIPRQNEFSSANIDKIVSVYRNTKNTSDTATVYVLYLSAEEGSPEQVGSTYKEFGLMLYDTPLNDFVRNDSQLLPNYLESTILHEFGHQVGLDHNTYTDCLMQAYVEDSPSGYQSAASIITDFCSYEKNLIAEQKVRL